MAGMEMKGKSAAAEYEGTEENYTLGAGRGSCGQQWLGRKMVGVGVEMAGKDVGKENIGKLLRNGACEAVWSKSEAF